MSQMSKSDTERAFRMAHSNTHESARYARELLDSGAIQRHEYNMVKADLAKAASHIIEFRDRWRRSAAVPNTDWDVP